MLDRSRTDISDRVRSLYAQDERSRSRRRAMATLGAICLLLVGLAVAYSFYDEAASEAFEEVSIEDLLSANEFDLASAELEGFLAQWPLATVGRDVREELSRVDALRLKYEAAQLNRNRPSGPGSMLIPAEVDPSGMEPARGGGAVMLKPPCEAARQPVSLRGYSTGDHPKGAPTGYVFFSEKVPGETPRTGKSMKGEYQ